MTLHLNQISYLWEKYSKHFEMDFDQFSEKVRGLTEDKYRQLLALFFNRQLNDMRRELLLLGVNLN